MLVGAESLEANISADVGLESSRGKHPRIPFLLGQGAQPRMEIFNQSVCASVDHPNDQKLIPIFIDTSERHGEKLLHQHARWGFFRAMINNSHTAMKADPILRDYLQQNRQSRWSVQKLSASAFQAFQRFEHLDSSHTSHSKFDVTTSIRIFNKAHSTHRKTPGNSYIMYTFKSQ